MTMAFRLNYMLSCLILCVSVVLADELLSDSPYYEYCKVANCGEKRQECRLLRGENIIFRTKYENKYEKKRQASAGSNESDEASRPASSEQSMYVATSGHGALNQTGLRSSAAEQASPIGQAAVNATVSPVNATASPVNATAPSVNATSTVDSAASRPLNSSTDVGIVGNDTDARSSSKSKATGIPIVASDVVVINDTEIKNNSVSAGKERSDLYRKFREMMNNMRPQQNDSLDDDDDHEFDNWFDMLNEIINNSSKTLKQHNITKYEEDHHQYYNSSFIVSEAIGKWYWVTMAEKENVQMNEVLSNAHRRAVTVRLSFDFPFYGHLIRNVTVATGGFLFTGEYVHSWLAATQYVAPLMANFDTSLSNLSTIKYVDNGTAFTVEWENVILGDEPHLGAFTFQATLHASGDIVFVYKQVPVIVENIRDVLHPVKVGLSDAYITDRIIVLIRRKTIYEYHRVEFSKEDIRNWTVIYLSALPTCVSKTSCYECLTQVPNFQCSWCSSLDRCSNGIDRGRKNWLGYGCDKSAYDSVHMCPGMQHLGNSLFGNPAFSPQEVSMAKQYNSGHVPGILAAIFLVAIMGSFSLWVLYAYRNPHTPSGQFLIRYRPSQWRWRRGEARYTAATIHM